MRIQKLYEGKRETMMCNGEFWEVKNGKGIDEYDTRRQDQAED